MKSQVVVRLAVLGVLFGLMLGMIAGCGGSAEEGRLPTLGEGDQWTYEGTYEGAPEGSFYTLNYEITGEGQVNGEDCWIMQMSRTFEPFEHVYTTSASISISKATHTTLQTQGSVSDTDVPLSFSYVYSYTPSDAQLFPLEVGKQVTRTVTAVCTTITDGESETKTTTTTHTLKVEAVEEITVQAGRFKCFKVTDTSNGGVSTWWYSGKVKWLVKTVHDDGSIEELKSYSA